MGGVGLIPPSLLTPPLAFVSLLTKFSSLPSLQFLPKFSPLPPPAPLLSPVPPLLPPPSLFSHHPSPSRPSHPSSCPPPLLPCPPLITIILISTLPFSLVSLAYSLYSKIATPNFIGPNCNCDDVRRCQKYPIAMSPGISLRNTQYELKQSCYIFSSP